MIKHVKHKDWLSVRVSKDTITFYQKETMSWSSGFITCLGKQNRGFEPRHSNYDGHFLIAAIHPGTESVYGRMRRSLGLISMCAPVKRRRAEILPRERRMFTVVCGIG